MWLKRHIQNNVYVFLITTQGLSKSQRLHPTLIGEFRENEINDDLAQELCGDRDLVCLSSNLLRAVAVHERVNLHLHYFSPSCRSRSSAKQGGTPSGDLLVKNRMQLSSHVHRNVTSLFAGLCFTYVQSGPLQEYNLSEISTEVKSLSCKTNPHYVW